MTSYLSQQARTWQSVVTDVETEANSILEYCSNQHLMSRVVKLNDELICIRILLTDNEADILNQFIATIE